MSMDVEVKREILIPGQPHALHWASNPCYTTRDGLGMVMTVVRRDSTGTDSWRHRTTKIQRMVSEDNGATWTPHGPAIQNDTYQSGNYTLSWHHFLDPDNDLLLSIYQTSRPNPAGGIKITKLYYEISRDAGKTWEPSRQIIHPGDEFDEILWMPTITGNEQFIDVDQGPFAKLDDGTIVFGLPLHIPSKYFPERQVTSAVFLRGQWTSDQKAIIWDVGDVIQVPPSVTPIGAGEPDLLCLGGQRLLTTLRCQGCNAPVAARAEKNKISPAPDSGRPPKTGERRGARPRRGEEILPSTRQWALSEDGGKTWSAPQMLRYDDGSMVCVPASIAAFERDPRTGKVYWFANILDKPVFMQSPRYPLTIAELDTERFCIIKDSVTVIQDLPEGAPVERSYTNFGHYVDRVTGEFVLMMAESPKISVEDFTADCIRFRIRVKD